MKIAVLNYIDGSVDILDTDVVPDHDFDWDMWLFNQGYHTSSCSWMIDVKTISFQTIKDNS